MIICHACTVISISANKTEIVVAVGFYLSPSFSHSLMTHPTSYIQAYYQKKSFCQRSTKPNLAFYRLVCTSL